MVTTPSRLFQQSIFWVFALSVLITQAAGSPTRFANDSVVTTPLAELQSEKLEMDEGKRETNRNVALTLIRAYLGMDQEIAAIATADEQLRDDPDDHVTWNAMGLIYLKGDQISLASKAFANASALSSDEPRGIYLYNLADAEIRLGEDETARQNLALVAAVDSLSWSANNALGNLRSGIALPPLQIRNPGRWSATASVSSGYDSNVVLASDSSLQTLSRSDAASPSATVSAFAGYQRDVWNGDLRGNGTAAFSYYTNPSTQTFNALSIATDASYGTGQAPENPMSYRYGPRLSGTFLNSNGFQFFNVSCGASLNSTYRLNAHSSALFEIPATYEIYNSSNTSPSDLRSGPTIGLSGAYQATFGPNQFSARLKYQYQSALGNNFRGHVISVPLTWSRPMGGTGFISTGLTGGLTSYPYSATLRRDFAIEATVSGGKQIWDKWTAMATLLAHQNFSNVDSAQYSKISLSILVSYEFL